MGAQAIPQHARQAGGGVTSELARARDALMLTYVPPSLPCREKERREVEAFVRDVLDGAGGCEARPRAVW